MSSVAQEKILAHWFTAQGYDWHPYEHAATPRVVDGAAARAHLSGGHSKSLLVCDKPGTLTLIIAEGAARADLKAIGQIVAARGRLSFAPEENMHAALGVRPGSVTPLALLNDTENVIKNVVFDANLLGYKRVWCHPLRNTASVDLPPEAMIAFIKAHHGAPIICNISSPDLE